MRTLFQTFLKNPVLVHMITIGVIVFGTYSYLVMPRELNPDLTFNWVIITTVYPGVSSEEIEKLISKPIEDEIAGVQKIDSITSTSAEGVGTVSVKFDQDISEDEFDKAYQDLRSELDRVELPEDAFDPYIFKLDSSILQTMLEVTISGDAPEKMLRRVADELQEAIKEIENVSGAAMFGDRDREIWIEADADQLDRHGIALTQIVQALSAKNLNVPGGKMEIGRSEYLLRTIGEFNSVEEIGNVIVRQIPGGSKIRIRDVADVHDTYEDRNVITRLDGKPCISLLVSKQSGGSTITIIDEVREVVAKFDRRLPDGIKITLASDTSIFIKNFIGTLTKNAIIGMVLVLSVLYLVMGVRNAIFVALGIPLSLLGTFMFIKFSGGSINGNSLFALVLVLGIVVDDAVVVMENVYRHLQNGDRPFDAALNGAQEVAMPVIAASLTTLAAFLPLALLPGLVGKFMRVIPIVVSFTIAASLFECFFILPSHIAEFGKLVAMKKRDRFFGAIRRSYVRLLKKALRWRYAVMIGAILILIACGSLVPLGLIGVDMFDSDNIPIVYVRVKMPPGTQIDETDRIMRQFENTALSLPKSELNAVITRTGFYDTDTGTTIDRNVGTIMIDLVEKKKRDRTVDQILDDLRAKCQSISGVVSVEFQKTESGPPAGSDVEVLVRGKKFDQLESLVGEFKTMLAEINGVTDIRDNYQLGKEEIKVRIDEDKADAYGLTVYQIAFAVRNAFEGVEATVLRDGDEEIDVIVKYRQSEDQSLSDLRNLNILTPIGILIPLRDVAILEISRGYSKIRRFKQERAITLRANVRDDAELTPIEVNQKIRDFFDEIRSRYPGYTIGFEGEFAEFQKAFSGIIALFGVGVMLIYFVLGTQFKSFIQPFIIMSAIPFAFVGAMFGLITTGNPLSISSMYGMVALAGIVVNSSIVLIEFINRQRSSGVRKWRSIMTAGSIRLRPILITTITTVFGLLPMAIGVGGKSRTWMPMASTIVWGLSVATIMTLLIIPVFYAIADDLFQWKGEKN